MTKPLTSDQQARLDNILFGPISDPAIDRLPQPQEAEPQQYLRTSHGMKPVSKPMRPREKDDFYPTPYKLCLEALGHGLTTQTRIKWILDVGCGTGVWGQAARKIFPEAHIIGLELDPDRACAAWQTRAYDEVIIGDFLTYPFRPIVPFDLIMGNPPYKHAEAFLDRSITVLREGFSAGQIVFLLRLAFLESQGRYERLFSNGKRPRQIMPLVERPSFTGDGKTDATAYGVFSWQRGMSPGTDTTLKWLSWR